MSRVALALEAEALEPGHSVRLVCPFCHGGGSGEKSMSLTHREDGALLFHCYRGNCGASGCLGGGRMAIGAIPTPARAAPHNYEQELSEIGREQMFWGMSGHVLHGHRVRAWNGRLAFPIWSPSGSLRGRVFRRNPNTLFGVGPKSLTHMYTTDGPSLAWGWSAGVLRGPVVVVEDAVSCLKLDTMGVRSVALLGTGMTEANKMELRANARRVFWALDRDAIGQSLAHDRENRLYFDKSEVLLIPRDFKDQTYEEIAECLSDVCSDHLSATGVRLTE
jgi:hypothetical protein